MEEPSQELTLRYYLEILLRRRWEALGTFAVVLVAGTLLTAFATPVFRARAKILVWETSPNLRSRDAQNPASKLLAVPQAESVDAQIDLLQSESFLDRVLRAAGAPARGPKKPSIQVLRVKETNVVDLAVESPDAKMAARVANAMAEQYLAQTRSLSIGETRDARRFLEGQRARTQQALAEAERGLARFRKEHEMAQLTDHGDSATKEVIELEARTRENANAIARLTAQLRLVRSQLRQEPSIRQTAVGRANPRRDALEARLADLETQRTALLAEYREDMPAVVAVNAQIHRVKEQLAREPQEQVLALTTPNTARDDLRTRAAELDRELRGLEAERAQLTTQFSGKRELLSELGPWDIRLAQLTRGRDVAEKAFLALDDRYQDLILRERAAPWTARIAERAVVPTAPVRPRKKINLIIAAMIALFLAPCAAGLREFFDDRLTTAEAVGRELGLSVLGEVPVIVGTPGKGGHTGPPLLTALSPLSPVADSYRWLRTAIRTEAGDDPLRTLLISSVRPGEGKSLTAINLAIATAQEGRTVILADADLRRPSLHRALGLPREPGLTDTLIDRVSLDEALHATDIPGLQVLTSGALPPNPGQLVSSARMEALLARLAGAADLVILDSPPAEPVMDAQLLSGKVDGVLLVADAGEARRSALQEVADQFERARGRLLGVVFNRVRTPRLAQQPYGELAEPSECGMRNAECGIGEREGAQAGRGSGVPIPHSAFRTPHSACGEDAMRDRLAAAWIGGAIVASMAFMVACLHIEGERTRAVLRAGQTQVQSSLHVLNARLTDTRDGQKRKAPVHEAAAPSASGRLAKASTEPVRIQTGKPVPLPPTAMPEPAADPNAPLIRPAATPASVWTHDVNSSAGLPTGDHADHPVGATGNAGRESGTTANADRIVGATNGTDAAGLVRVYQGGHYYHQFGCRRLGKRLWKRTFAIAPAAAERRGWSRCPTCRP